MIDPDDILTTWRIWARLNRLPKAHPLVTYYQQRDSNRSLSVRWRIGLMSVFVIVGTGLIVGTWLDVMVTLLLAVGLLPLGMIAFSATLLGAFWTMDISGVLLHERDSPRYELLRLTPDGAAGISWLIAQARMHRHHWLRQAYRLVRGVALTVLTVVIMAALLLVASASVDSQMARLLQDAQLVTLLGAVAMGAALLWMDYIQSVVLAALLGMLVPHRIPSRTGGQIIAGLLFLALQIGSYMIVVLLWLALDVILSALALSAGGQTLAFVLLGIGIVAIVRESLITVLWTVLQQHQRRA